MLAVENHAYVVGEVVLVDPSEHGAPYKLGVVVHRTPKTLRIEVPDPTDPNTVTTYEFSKANAAMHVRRVTFEERKLASFMFTTYRALNAEANRRDPEHKGGDDIANKLWAACSSLGDAHVLLVGHCVYASDSDEATRRWWPIVHYFDHHPNIKRYQPPQEV